VARYRVIAHPNVDVILAADQWARDEATRLVEELKG